MFGANGLKTVFFYLLPFATSAAITTLIILFLKRIALKIDLVDLPGGRKQHQGNIPLIGGLAILIGFLFTCLILSSPLSWPLTSYKPLFCGMILIVFLGLADDLHELTPRLRLLGQMIIVLLAIFWGNNALSDLGNLFFLGNIHFDWIGSTIFTILAWLSFINASNMQDGTDGLAGTVSFMQITMLCLVAFWGHAELDSIILTIFLGALLVFLIFNFPLPKNKRPAKIFMGDAGSLLLGFFTAWFAIHFSQYSFQNNHYFPPPVTFLWITAIPLFDFFAVTVGRIRRHRSPMKGGRDHFHHFCQRKGYSPFFMVLGISSLSLIFSIIGLSFVYFGVSEGISFTLLLILLIGYVFFFSSLNHSNELSGDIPSL